MSTNSATPDGDGHLAPQLRAIAPFAASSVYQTLTAELNQGRCRTIMSSGQACVLHRIAFVSKDGDWLLREDQESIRHVIAVLTRHGARYRLGAPLDARWLAAGWSTHAEYQEGGLRVRTDFVTRPPRIASARLAELWVEAETSVPYLLPIPDLIALKRTLRDRDYPIIGALAQRLDDPASQLLFSQSIDTLAHLVGTQVALARSLADQRPLLQTAIDHPERIRLQLNEERFEHQERDRRRMRAFAEAIQPWAQAWQALAPTISHLPLDQAHEIVVRAAEPLLPQSVVVPP